MDGPDARPVTRPVAVQVNFRFELDGLPVFGPGAKVQVTLGPDASLLECYRFWRRPCEERHVAILPPEQAIERLRRDPAYAELPDDRARVVFDEVRLGYLALPPRELQGYLFPVYAFRGTVSTPELERYDHTRYVVAVDIQPEQIKRLRVAHRAASGDLTEAARSARAIRVMRIDYDAAGSRRVLNWMTGPTDAKSTADRLRALRSLLAAMVRQSGATGARRPSCSKSNSTSSQG